MLHAETTAFSHFLQANDSINEARLILSEYKANVGLLEQRYDFLVDNQSQDRYLMHTVVSRPEPHGSKLDGFLALLMHFLTWFISCFPAHGGHVSWSLTIVVPTTQIHTELLRWLVYMKRAQKVNRLLAHTLERRDVHICFQHWSSGSAMWALCRIASSTWVATSLTADIGHDCQTLLRVMQRVFCDKFDEVTRTTSNGQLAKPVVNKYCPNVLWGLWKYINN